jgi:predicted ABC-type exoprotein transport system permease subunit
VIPVDRGYSIMLYDIPATNIFNYLTFFQIFSLKQHWAYHIERKQAKQKHSTETKSVGNTNPTKKGD